MERGRLWIVIVFFTLLACACTKKIYIPTETAIERVDTLRQIQYRTDTVIDCDTIKITLSGDTIVKEVIRWRLRYKDRIDTVYKISDATEIHTETVPVEVEKIVEVERKLTYLEKVFMNAGKASLILIIVFMAFYFIRKRK